MRPRRLVSAELCACAKERPVGPELMPKDVCGAVAEAYGQKDRKSCPGGKENLGANMEEGAAVLFLLPFERRFCITHTALELLVLWPLPLKCWAHMCVPLWLAKVVARV